MLLAINPMYPASHFFNSEKWIVLSTALSIFVLAMVIVIAVFALDAKIESNKTKRAKERRQREIRKAKKEEYQKRYKKQIKNAKSLYQRDMARLDQTTKIDGRIRNASGKMN